MRTLLITLTLMGTGLTYAQEEPKKKKAVAAVGQKAPDFAIKDSNNKVFKLSEFMKKGDKNVVLVFSRGGF